MSKGDGCGGPRMSAFSLSWRELGEREPQAEKKATVCRTRWPSGHGMHDAL